MRDRFDVIIIILFFLGWSTYSFSLFDIDNISFTLLLFASTMLAVLGLARKPILNIPIISIFLSCLLAMLVALYYYTEVNKIITHFIQCLIGIGVTLGVLNINWEKNISHLQKIIACISIILVVYAVYQYLARKLGWPFAFLPITNLQLSADYGLQRGAFNFTRGSGIFTRVSSLFAEPSDLGRYMVWVFAIGYGCKSFGLRILLIFLAISGVLISQSLGSYVCIFLMIFGITILNRKIKQTMLVILISGLVFALQIYVAPLAYNKVQNRFYRIVSSSDFVLLQEIRLKSIPQNIEFAFNKPIFGHGLASTKKEIPYNVVSSSWELALIERGIIGTLLFVLPFLWVLYKLLIRRVGKTEVQNTALLLLLVEMYSFLVFSSLFFPPTYFALGLGLWAVLNKEKKLFKQVVH